jgi:HEAT repeat protein
MKKAPVSSDPSRQNESSIADLYSTEGGVRREARETLTFVGRQAVRHWIPLLKGPDAEIRREAPKVLADIADARACLDLVAALEDPDFGVRWLAAEGLISIGRNALRPLMKALTKRSGSAWLREGAHHVLHDLAGKDLEVEDLVRSVIAGQEGIEPEIGGDGSGLCCSSSIKGFD